MTQEQKSKQFEQGQVAGQAVYQERPSLTTREQAKKAYERFVGRIEDLSAEERSDFMQGFGSGYYLASQKGKDPS